MSARRRPWTPRAGLLAVAVALSFAAVPPQAGAETPPAPIVEQTGPGRYTVDRIEVDTASGEFSLPARVIDLGVAGAPLEFLAVSLGGPKSYESLLELETDAIAFNLACILIGLDSGRSTPPKGNFDPTPAEGDPVELSVEWSSGNASHVRPVSDLLELTGGERPSDDWVYIGSEFWPDGRYAAQESGILIGFVHDRESIIQHRSGLGLQAYGAVTMRPGADIPRGLPIRLVVRKKTAG